MDLKALELFHPDVCDTNWEVFKAELLRACELKHQNDSRHAMVLKSSALKNTTPDSGFSRNCDTVIDFLRGATPSNGYATCLGYGNFPDTVYAHTGCYNMSTQPACSTCIIGAYQYARSTNTIGARYWDNGTTNRCNLRYEISNFTAELPPGVLGPNASASAPPPTPRASTGAPLPPGSAPGGPGSPTSGSSGSSSNTGIVVGAAVGSVVAVFLILLLSCYFLRKRISFRRERSRAASDELQGTRGAVVFSYQELRLATKDFSERNKLGQGGFGSVYKAVLQDGDQVAVKKLSLGSPQGKRDFVNEISIITSIRHRNLVRLKGYCAEDEHRILVLEFLENGSIDHALFENQTKVSLDWPARFRIILGVAKGLAYLHEESHMQIIHRDIKASNILLDGTLEPKISDFGISKLGHFTTTRVAGTVGYMAPEYVLRGRLTTKADVFSFGILVLEIISGRRCMDSTLSAEKEILLQWTWSLYQDGKLEQIVDARMGNKYDANEVYRATHVAMLCAQEFQESRPDMSLVVAMLMGFVDVEPLSVLQAPHFFGKMPQQIEWASSSSSRTGTTTSSSQASAQVSITEMNAR